MHFQCKFRFISPVIELEPVMYNGRSDYQMTILNNRRPDSIAIMSFQLHTGELNGALSRSHLFHQLIAFLQQQIKPCLARVFVDHYIKFSLSEPKFLTFSDLVEPMVVHRSHDMAEYVASHYSFFIYCF